ncbi:carbohydrate-binding protein [Spirosoma areae]
MKTLILFLLVLVSFTACKKGENDVNPQKAAEAVAGTYTLTSFRYASGSDVINLPKMPYTQGGQTVSGTVKLSPTSEENVTLTLTLKVTGEQDQSIDIDNVEVKKTSEAYGLYVDNQLVADVDGNNIIFNLNETDPQTKETLELKFTAKK